MGNQEALISPKPRENGARKKFFARDNFKRIKHLRIRSFTRGFQPIKPSVKFGLLFAGKGMPIDRASAPAFF
jgi:hypothetical protein